MMNLKQLLQLLKCSNHCRLPLKRYILNLFYLQYRHIYSRKLLSQSLSLDHLSKTKIAFPDLQFEEFVKTRKARSDAENAEEDVLCIYCVDLNHTYLKARSDAENAKEDVLCIYCVDLNHTYLKSSECWVACQLCEQWAHLVCAGVNNADLEEIHICLFCD
ncbi:hypothetical protein EVAR_78246_1 [Eumeta japonica]|uniref:PHD-type domain-containing protein n=1 Tax=Eumeta variegata TaxID=151549 RepID=A0A4C1T3Y5_EUMVA|nr:hypothetical protein EVAR_78246_1 [Eumeta japonica]